MLRLLYQTGNNYTMIRIFSKIVTMLLRFNMANGFCAFLELIQINLQMTGCNLQKWESLDTYLLIDEAN